MQGYRLAPSSFKSFLLVLLLVLSALWPIALATPVAVEASAPPASSSGPICGFPIYKSLYENSSHTGSRYLAATSQHAYIYVDSGNPTQDEINNLANEFDNKIWPSDTTVFGTISKDRINIHLETMDGPGGLGGYYYPGTWDIYIDTADLNLWGNEIAAHEFQHLIHDKYDSDEDLWVNEGMSDLAIYLLYGPNAFSLSGHESAFEALPDNDLTVFTNELSDYGSAYTFILWTWEHFGGNDTIRKMVANTENGFQGVLDTLRGVDPSYNFTDIQYFSMWSVANTLDDTVDYNGLYGYKSLDISMALESSTNTFPTNITSDVNSWGNDYYGFTNGDKRDLVVTVGRLDGSVNFTLIGLGPGTITMMSAMADQYNAQSTLTVPNFGSEYQNAYLVVSGWEGKRYTFSADLKDITPPVTTLAVNPPEPDGLNGYYITNPNIGFVTSEPATTYFHWDDGTDVKYCSSCTPPSVPQAPEGDHILYYHSVDPIGNKELVDRSHEFLIDTLKPETYSNVTPLQPDGEKGWYISPTIVSLTSSEDANISYRWDSGFFHNYTGPMTVEEGSHTLYYYSTDLAGNQGDTHYIVLKVDTVPPVLHYDLYPAAPDGINGWYITQPTLAISVEEPDVTVFYSMDGSAVHFIYNQPVKVAEGSHTLEFWAVDAAGNTAQIVSKDFNVDTTSPVTKLTTDPVRPDGLNGWYVSAPSVYLETDKDASINYKVDDSAQRRYTGPIIIEEGEHMVAFWSKDRAGNVEPARTFKVKLDTITPDTKITVQGSPTGDWYIDDPMISFSTDSGGNTYYSWDNGQDQKFVVPIKPQDGTHELRYYSIDEAGNKGSSKSMTFSVDTIDPVAFFGVTPTFAFQGELVIVDATNSSDNLQLVNYKVDFGDGDIEDLKGEPVINHIYSIPGTYKITLTVTDEAGRMATYSKDIFVDKKPTKSSGALSLLTNPFLIILLLLVILGAAGVGVYRYRKKQELLRAVAAYEAYQAQLAKARKAKGKKISVKKTPPKRSRPS